MLIGGIGYRWLSDHSIGVAVADLLMARSWPAGIVVEDLSYNPITLVQRLEDEPRGRRFSRAVLVSGVARGRRPGEVTCYRWDGALPPDEEIQRAVAEALTGIILLDHTLVVVRHFGALPEEVAIVEVEPEVHAFGDAFSRAVAGALPSVCELVARLATDPTAAGALPRAPLGGGPSTPCAR